MITFQMGVYCVHPFFQVRSVPQQGKNRLTSIQYNEWKNAPNQPLVTVKKIIIIININIIGHKHLVENKFEKIHDNLFFIWYNFLSIIFLHTRYDLLTCGIFHEWKYIRKSPFFSVGELNLLFSLIFMYYTIVPLCNNICLYFSNILFQHTYLHFLKSAMIEWNNILLCLVDVIIYFKKYMTQYKNSKGRIIDW